MVRYMEKNCLAIITARGGSKRIPRKNIKDFCGRPIIQYPIKAALESKIFDEVMVSTDDYEIKKVAEKYGAKVPFMRTKRTSNDMAMTHEVISEVLEEYKKRDINFKFVCCIYPTAPFITSNKLVMSFNKLIETGADSVVPIVAFSYPPQRCLVVKNGYVSFKWPQNCLMRSQDLERWFHDCGQYYFLNVKRFLKTHNLIMEHTIPIIIDEMEVQDIDTYTDWELAELKYQTRIKEKRNEVY